MDQNQNDNRWKVELAFTIAILVLVGGLGFAFLQTLYYHLSKEPLFLTITVVLIIVLPVLSAVGGYLFGRHRKGNEAQRDKERTHETHMAMWTVAAGMVGQRRPDVVDAAPRSPSRNYAVPYIDNGKRINPPVDYRTMAHEWLNLGYPTFTREYLHKLGAGIGDNNNYTVLTDYLISNGVIQRSTGRLPSDDPSMPDHTLYKWADATGRMHGRREVGQWIDSHDWSDI